MKINYRLSKKGKNVSGIAVYEVMARVHSGKVDQYAKTGVFVPMSFTDKNGNKKTTWAGGSVVIPRISYADKEQVSLRELLTTAKARLSEIDEKVTRAFDKLAVEKSVPPKEWLQDIIDGNDRPKVNEGDTLLYIFEQFLASDALKVSDGTLRHYRVVMNAVERYQEDRNVSLTLETLTPDILRDFSRFIVEEHPGKRGGNYAVSMLRKLRAFVRWANGLSKSFPVEPFTHNNPFDHFVVGSEQYGTPYYLTIEERNRLAEFDLPPRLARQRDIFVFQCLVGCRVGDLWAMKKDDIVDGALQYIPRKTKEGRPITVRVPLNERAKAILDRYKDNGDPRLLPFVAQQQYNLDIKEMLRLAGITRRVTVLNTVTRQEEKRPICEVASSHMARRTFVGNLYKQVKDPNLVGKLSGHKEGSKAFARYRDIDDDMARELVGLLE